MASAAPARFRALAMVAAGGQGQVCRAEDSLDGRLVAIKVVAAGPRSAAEFAVSQAIAAPGFVSVSEVVSLEEVGLPIEEASDRAVGLVMPWVEGRSVRERLAALSNPVARRDLIGELLRQLSSTLAALHRAGFVHGDVTPANILVVDDDAASTAIGPKAMLLDGGLASRRGVQVELSGTPAYWAPERLDGLAHASADLFGLGATLYDALAGRPPYAGRELAEILASHDQPPSPAVAIVAPWLGAELTALLEDLISPSPARRQFAAEIARRASVALGAPVPASVFQPPTFSIPGTPSAAFVEELRDLLLAADQGRSVAWRLCGGHRAGARLLVDEAVRRYRVAALEAGRAPRPVVRRVAGHPPPETARAVLELISLEPGASAAATRSARLALQAAARSPGAVAIVLDDEDHLAHPSFDLACPKREVPRASALEIAAIVLETTGTAVTARWASELCEATDGRLGHLVELLARAEPASIATRSVASLLSRADPRCLLEHRDTQQAYEVLEAVALCEGRLTVSLLAAMLEATAATLAPTVSWLLHRGLLIADDGLSLSAELSCESLITSATPARRRKRHRAALAWLDREAASGQATAALDGARLPHLLYLGPRDEAIALASRVADERARCGDPRGATARMAAALERADPAQRSITALHLARHALDAGEFTTAADAAALAARSRDKTTAAEASLLLAQTLQRSGKLAEAEATLVDLEARDGLTPLMRAKLCGLRVRILVGLGRYREALDAAEAGAGLPPESSRFENSALAAFYLGDHGGALAIVERGELLLASTEAGGPRLAIIAGMSHQAGGALAAAHASFALAQERYAARGDPHGEAVARLNLASIAAETGQHAEALVALDRGIADLESLGARQELAAAFFNRGNSALHLGMLEQAAEDARRAAALGGDDQACQPALFANLLRGELSARRGDLSGAEVICEQVTAAAERAGDVRAALLGWLQLALVRAERGRHSALQALDEVAARAKTEDDRERLLLARGRVSALLGLPECAPALQDLERAAVAATVAGRRDAAWRIHAVAARTAMTLGDLSLARVDAARANEALGELLRTTPPEHRAGVRTDPDARALASTESALRLATPTPAQPSGAISSEWLQRLLILSRRLNSELRLERILEDVLDTAIELTRAERGFLLLRDPQGQLAIVAARNFGAAALDGDDTRYSRSIAERAALTGEPVITVDAGDDARFDSAASVALLKLRSVLAVPLRQRGSVTGTIYVDHRYRRAAFDDEASSLLGELADIAALAIANARLYAELAQARAESAALNESLLQEASERERALAAARASLSAVDRAALAHAYPGIIGESSAIRGMLGLVDRAAASEVGVVIFGESGTGKELVARALHEHGERRSGPFVAINCAAFAESLLESELFGHVRGAFTGADRDRAGLLEVADGGTLFLDEVADMGAAMQARLLRVLQEREVRRLGGNEQRSIDVRVVCASNRRLRQLVATGEFREDLYFRLAVLEIEVPPLRERIDDIGLLAQHFLGREPRGAAHSLSPRSLKALAAYAWPGNVRELENRIARARAVCDGVIQPEHLDLPTTPRASPRGPNEFALKPQVERLERELITAAMTHAKGNQSAAARLLGLSRYGLQKKLARQQD